MVNLPEAITDIVLPQSNDIQLTYSVPAKRTKDVSFKPGRILFTIPTL